MKNITLYLLLVVFCFAGCKKTEVTPKFKFLKVTFIGKGIIPRIKYENQIYIGDPEVPVKAGDKKFEIYDHATGAKVLDTVLNITGPITYYVYLAPGTTTPVVQTEVPPVPPPVEPPAPPVDPNNPLANEPAAPEGFMKIKVANLAQSAFPYPAIDVVFNSLANNPNTGLEELTPAFTIKGVGQDFNSQFQLIQRPVIDGVPITSFKITFIDPASGELIKSIDGNTVKNGSRATVLKVNEFNNFMINVKESLADPEQANSIKVGDNYFVILPSIAFQN